MVSGQPGQRPTERTRCLRSDPLATPKIWCSSPVAPASTVYRSVAASSPLRRRLKAYVEKEECTRRLLVCTEVAEVLQAAQSCRSDQTCCRFLRLTDACAELVFRRS